MTNIRRYDVSNHPVFMTVVCYKRKPWLKENPDKDLLLSVMREIKQETLYTMLGYVILNDHFHWMIRIQPPTCNGDLSTPPRRSGCDQRELPDNYAQFFFKFIQIIINHDSHHIYGFANCHVRANVEIAPFCLLRVGLSMNSFWPSLVLRCDVPRPSMTSPRPFKTSSVNP